MLRKPSDRPRPGRDSTSAVLAGDGAPSDAERILESLGCGRGQTPPKIAPGHLAPLYAKTRETRGRGDLAAARAILPAGDPDAPTADPVAVIVETRRHRDLPFVIAQVDRLLALRIQLYHGPENADLLAHPTLARLRAEGRLVATQLRDGRVAAPIYNGLFLCPEFWRTMIGRGKILVFQTDSLLCPRSPHRLGDFLEFDYIGGVWDRNRPIGLTIDGGSGGFSLRDWSKSVACLERFDPRDWQGGEDGYFGFHLPLVGGRVARMADCAAFCTQNIALFERSFAVHQPLSLPRREKLRLLAYCPQSWRLLSRRLSRVA